MRYVKPGVYTKEIDFSSIWVCSCHGIGFKSEEKYLSHTRSIKIKKIKAKNLS